MEGLAQLTARIEAANPLLSAIATGAAHRILAAGDPLGPPRGVTLTVKDCLDSA